MTDSEASVTAPPTPEIDHVENAKSQGLVIHHDYDEICEREDCYWCNVRYGDDG